MRFLLTLLAVMALAIPAAAQTVWDETANGGGDAPDLIPGQMTEGSGGLDAITGELVSPDADLFCIMITDPGSFMATTCEGTTSDDTRLFLFDTNTGNGVTFNDDDPNDCAPSGYSLESTITGQFVTMGDQYWLGVARYSSMAQNADGLSIWNSSPFDVERQPDGPGAPGPLAGWYLTTSTGFPYTVFLTGCAHCGTVATEESTWGAVKSLYR